MTKRCLCWLGAPPGSPHSHTVNRQKVAPVQLTQGVLEPPRCRNKIRHPSVSPGSPFDHNTVSEPPQRHCQAASQYTCSSAPPHWPVLVLWWYWATTKPFMATLPEPHRLIVPVPSSSRERLWGRADQKPPQGSLLIRSHSQLSACPKHT